MTLKIRLLYKKHSDHIACRNASEYIYDPRDLIDGKPHPLFLPYNPIEKDPDEVEFDHEATQEELEAAFKEMT